MRGNTTRVRNGSLVTQANLAEKGMIRSNSRKDLKKKGEPHHVKQDSSLKEIDENEIKKSSKQFETLLDGEIEKLSEITHDQSDRES